MASTAPSDWRARSRALVYTQFFASNWAIPLADAIAEGRASKQGLYDAVKNLWRIGTITDDPTSPAYGVGRGVQLDRIGKVVGQPRGAAGDDQYRPILRAKIIANRSNGGANTIIRMFVAMFAGEGTPLITNGWIAQFTVQLVGVIMDPLLVPAAAGLLRQATQGGNRAVLEWAVVDDDESLICNAEGANQGWGGVDDLTVGGALAGAVSAT